MRKLVTVRKVKAIDEIAGADFIEEATVDGWSLVVRKGEFKVGDFCVFFEIDSMLPQTPMFKFLRKTTESKGGVGYRIRTVKLRGVLSQGLALPLDGFPEIVNLGAKPNTDYSKVVRVWKYEPKNNPKTSGSTNLSKSKPAGVFPYFLVKTTQPRLQNKLKYFKNKTNTLYEVTNKYDGSSMTVWDYQDSGFTPKRYFNWYWLHKLVQKFDKTFNVRTQGVCSRNIDIQEVAGNRFWEMAKSLKLLDIIKGQNIAIQGELISPHIQSNYEGVDTDHFMIFDIYDITTRKYYTPEQRKNWMNKFGGTLEHAKINMIEPNLPEQVGYKAFENNQSIKDFQTLVKGDNYSGSKIREGLVFKAMEGSHSFKVISNAYLLKET